MLKGMLNKLCRTRSPRRGRLLLQVFLVAVGIYVAVVCGGVDRMDSFSTITRLSCVIGLIAGAVVALWVASIYFVRLTDSEPGYVHAALRARNLMVWSLESSRRRELICRSRGRFGRVPSFRRRCCRVFAWNSANLQRKHNRGNHAERLA
jgi:hypothetical protein